MFQFAVRSSKRKIVIKKFISILYVLDCLFHGAKVDHAESVSLGNIEENVN